MTGFELREESYDGPVAQTLIAEVQQEYISRYGGPDESPVDPQQFTPPAGCFFVGYLDGQPVAMGGLRGHADGVVEIKRMYVVPGARRRGLSRVVLGRLEAAARALGANRAVLETGSRQPEAIRLYETSGYERIDGFGHYSCEPGSFSFGKDLS